MKNILSFPVSTGVLSLLILSGCSSSNSGGGSTASVPANAITISADNAEATIASSVQSLDQVDLALAADATPTLGLLDALDLAQPLIDTALTTQLNSGVDIVTAADANFTINCDVSGTFSIVGHNDITPPTTTSTGTFTANNCNDGLGFVINSNFTFSSFSNDVTGAYDDTAAGDITISFTNAQDTSLISFLGLDFAETGNDLTPGAETYTVSRATFAVDFTINGVSQNGFLVQLLAPIVESSGGEDSCPESGTILITGANGTTAEGTYNGDGTMTISANGTVINPAAACIL